MIRFVYSCFFSLLILLVQTKMAKTVVRIHFLDDSVRAFAIEENTTASELKQIIVERIELKEESCFALFERKDGWGKYYNKKRFNLSF